MQISSPRTSWSSPTIPFKSGSLIWAMDLSPMTRICRFMCSRGPIVRLKSCWDVGIMKRLIFGHWAASWPSCGPKTCFSSISTFREWSPGYRASWDLGRSGCCKVAKMWSVCSATKTLFTSTTKTTLVCITFTCQKRPPSKIESDPMTICLLILSGLWWRLIP